MTIDKFLTVERKKVPSEDVSKLIADMTKQEETDILTYSFKPKK